MKVEAIKPVFYAGKLYKQGDVFDLLEGHKLNEKVMRLLDGVSEKTKKKKNGGDPDTFSEINKADERTAAEKAADKVLAE